MKAILITFLGLAILISAYAFRKKMPYEFEIVPRNASAWVICTTTWSIKNCTVTIGDKNGLITQKELNDSLKYVELDGLKNDTEYTVRIKRNDFTGKIRYKAATFEVVPKETYKKYVVLVGASVGRTWNLNNLNDRKKIDDTFYGYRGRYNFDKTQLIDALRTSAVKPDAVIIKECSAYFPRDPNESIKTIDGWVHSLKEAGIKPFLATVVPVTPENDAANNNKKMESINLYNDALRKYAQQSRIPVLDLQEMLSDKSDGKYLKNTYADADGLHLNHSAYADVLDQYLVTFTDKNI